MLPQSNDIEKSIRKVSGIGKKSQILGSVGKKPFALSLKIAKKIKQNKVENLDESIKRNYYLSRASTELYDDLIRVPLLFIGHGIKEPKKISKQTRHIDIIPTIFELIEEESTSLTHSFKSFFNQFDIGIPKPFLDLRKYSCLLYTSPSPRD